MNKILNAISFAGMLVMAATPLVAVGGFAHADVIDASAEVNPAVPSNRDVAAMVARARQDGQRARQDGLRAAQAARLEADAARLEGERARQEGRQAAEAARAEAMAARAEARQAVREALEARGATP